MEHGQVLNNTFSAALQGSEVSDILFLLCRLQMRKWEVTKHFRLDLIKLAWVSESVVVHSEASVTRESVNILHHFISHVKPCNVRDQCEASEWESLTPRWGSECS